eukprot:TRINITY_DN2631_c0_g1_i29.p1 TRINITY_DN2631_c0_g1~~TRINITY_DN2631_c0_g1_i29.p1  ORF type:complete len:161 (-),score=18.55 TRINITY_DN2631_c0_g1_i29:906-1388(-)
MSTQARRRLIRDFKNLQHELPIGISGAPKADNLLYWEAVIFGPEDTPWEGGTFRLTLEFSEDYPAKPPHVRFKSKMFHPNVYSDGNICLDILNKQWSQLNDVSAVLISVRSLLCDPNPDSPANQTAAKMFQEDIISYHMKVKEIVRQSWEFTPSPFSTKT